MITAICPAMYGNKGFKAYQNHADSKNPSFGIGHRKVLLAASMAIALSAFAPVLVNMPSSKDKIESKAQELWDSFSPEIKDNALRIATDEPKIELTMPRNDIPKCAIEGAKWRWGSVSAKYVIEACKTRLAAK